ncbi:transcriptional initiation protein Tat [Microbacterium sp. YY-01]|uniref:transcriptional initiation protein Tat n=1 Tax=Microbacterium sp. YY-01 TaxID=3421634 RepID=UPI003D16D03D
MKDTSVTLETKQSVSRRTVVKGAAWSIPVIATAVAVPAHAASAPDVDIVSPEGDLITDWKGDHHYGSDNDNPKRRSYDFPIDLRDSSGNPLVGVTVSVTAAGSNGDGDLLGIYRYPAPSNGGPESDPSRTATAVTDANGRAMFAVNTQNLTSKELREENTTATLTITVADNGDPISKVVTVKLLSSD